MDKILAVEMTVEQALEFYERCVLAEANTEEARTEILQRMVEEKKCTRAYTTGRTKEQLIADLSKEQDILVINNPEDIHDVLENDE